MTLPDLNEDGQRHADRYVQLTKPWVPLRALDGGWTGHGLAVDQLTYTDHEKAYAASHGFRNIDGLARIDYHERFGPLATERGVKEPMVLHRGGSGYLDASAGLPPGSAVKYGMLAMGDIVTDNNLGRVAPSGESRGSCMQLDGKTPIPEREGLFAMRPKPMPHLLYKGPSAETNWEIPWGSLWWTYSDLGGEWGGDYHYMPLLWSFLNAGGGGMVRGILKDGHRVRQLAVPRQKCGVYSDTDGARIGDALGQYVRTSSKACGWALWCYKTIFTGNVWTYLAEQVG